VGKHNKSELSKSDGDKKSKLKVNVVRIVIVKRKEKATTDEPKNGGERADEMD
jgi:hypothetical protein